MAVCYWSGHNMTSIIIRNQQQLINLVLVKDALR